jgi:hypothetical protein
MPVILVIREEIRRIGVQVAQAETRDPISKKKTKTKKPS